MQATFKGEIKVNPKIYECHHGNNKGAELAISRHYSDPEKFMITLAGAGFEAHRDMTREDMEDMISWIKEAINADQG